GCHDGAVVRESHDRGAGARQRARAVGGAESLARDVRRVVRAAFGRAMEARAGGPIGTPRRAAGAWGRNRSARASGVEHGGARSSARGRLLGAPREPRTDRGEARTDDRAIAIADFPKAASLHVYASTYP